MALVLIILRDEFVFFVFIGAPELTGLLRTQAGVLPTFRIVTDQKGEKSALFSSPIPSSTDQQQHTPTIHLPSPAVLGTEEPPLIAYRLEDYNKKFGAEAKQETESLPRGMISVESLLRGQQVSKRSDSQSGPVTSTPISSLLSLAKHMPVQLSTSAPASVSSQIQQLLANLSRSQIATSVTSSMSPATVSSFQAPISIFGGTHTQAMVITTAQLSQSGSPLQNSVPTLMSSLGRSVLSTGGSIIRKTASAVTDSTQSSPQESMADKSTAVKKIDFQDFVAPASASRSLSSAQHSDTIDLTNLADESENQTEIRPGTFLDHQTLLLDKSVISNSSASVGTQSVLKPVSTTFSPKVVSSGTSEVYKEETLGQVSSMLESSPITEKQTPVIDLTQKNTTGKRLDLLAGVTVGPGLSVSVPVGVPKTGAVKTPSSVSTSYTATPKPSLSNLACTRTRKIKTPKQFDL